MKNSTLLKTTVVMSAFLLISLLICFIFVVHKAMIPAVLTGLGLVYVGGFLSSREDMLIHVREVEITPGYVVIGTGGIILGGMFLAAGVMDKDIVTVVTGIVILLLGLVSVLVSRNSSKKNAR